ncbi:hypothetical protein [Sanguibacter sp. HDW7]|uniref:hypothetical protein n=1 Tax=Sanguibacter sp. HDW7 TaxID=2714931 RepID=UPI00140DE93F|nr:hypothetical protein [Sanguibacter sp. HDW7]QIK83577.1 hypothetical protein G7063_08005 [Sanguibacter sp. HDW7]
MSLSLSKKSSTSGAVSKSQKGIGATLLPQVNLLPTDVTDARNLKKLKAVLAVVIALVLVLVGGLTFVASGLVSKAQGRVDAANAETTRLQVEQRKYAEVPIVLGRIDETENALFRSGMGDVRWKPTIDALTSQIPEELEVRKLVIEGWDAAQGSISLNDPSQRSGLHTRISIEMVSKTLPDVAKLLADLEALPTVESARLFSSEVEEGEGDDFTHSTIASVTLNGLAASGTTFPKELR